MKRYSTKIRRERVGGRYRNVEIFREGLVSGDVEKYGSFGNEVRGSCGLSVEVGSKAFGDDVDGSDDLVVIGFTDAANLNEQILGVLGHEDTEGGCAVVL